MDFRSKSPDVGPASLAGAAERSSITTQPFATAHPREQWLGSFLGLVARGFPGDWVPTLVGRFLKISELPPNKKVFCSPLQLSLLFPKASFPRSTGGDLEGFRLAPDEMNYLDGLCTLVQGLGRSSPLRPQGAQDVFGLKRS